MSSKPPTKNRTLLIILGLALVLLGIFLAFRMQRNQVSPEQAYSNNTYVRVQGSVACLPHTGDGPSTLECAYGLRAENGAYYKLKAGERDLTDIPMEKTVEVSGTFHAEKDAVYETDGTIRVDNIIQK